VYRTRSVKPAHRSLLILFIFLLNRRMVQMESPAP